MAIQSEVLVNVREALREFEEAVKHHEHRAIGESEVVRRQEVDFARDHVVEVVRSLIEQTRADG